MPPKYIFFRHGEATHNVAFRNGEPDAFTAEKYKDPPLTSEGKDQVIAAAKNLADYKIIGLWSSPLTRCIETSLELFEELDIQEMFLHDNLMEITYKGQVCNLRKRKEELKKEHDGLFKMDFMPDYSCIWDSNETSYFSYQRMFMVLKLIEDIYKNESEDSYVLIVSHQNIMSPFVKKSLKNAEYCILSQEEIFSD